MELKDIQFRLKKLEETLTKEYGDFYDFIILKFNVKTNEHNKAWTNSLSHFFLSNVEGGLIGHRNNKDGLFFLVTEAKNGAKTEQGLSKARENLTKIKCKLRKQWWRHVKFKARNPFNKKDDVLNLNGRELRSHFKITIYETNELIKDVDKYFKEHKFTAA